MPGYHSGDYAGSTEVGDVHKCWERGDL